MTTVPSSHPDAASQAVIFPAILALRDFPDRLSPIIVKELRQGLRQPTFVILFIFLQAMLAMMLAMTMMDGAAHRAADRLELGRMVSIFIFVITGITVLVVQPMRGLGALVSETRTQAIDLLLLTRLDAWRITFGKWLGLVMQSALLLVAIVPYLVMRYFLGGMQLFSELLGLLFMISISAVLCAATVGLSSIGSIFIRGLIAFCGLIGMFLMFVWYEDSYMHRSSSSASGGFGLSFLPDPGVAGYDVVMWIIGFALFLAVLAYLFLEMGATRIAAISENRSMRKRLIGLAALIVVPALFYAAPKVAYISFLVISPIVLVDALTESSRLTSSVVQRVMRRRGLMRLVPRSLLYPGWPSGINVVLAVYALGFAMVYFLGFVQATYEITRPTYMAILLLWLLCFVQPALWTILFRSKESQPLASYIGILFGTACLTFVFIILDDAIVRHGSFLICAVPLMPPIGFTEITTSYDESRDNILSIMALITSAAYLFLMRMRARNHREEIRQHEAISVRLSETKQSPHGDERQG